jgi:hypothetical protein
MVVITEPSFIFLLILNDSFFKVRSMYALKWHKERKAIELRFEYILHYQRIIVALTETDRIMKEIDEVDFFNC